MKSYFKFVMILLSLNAFTISTPVNAQLNATTILKFLEETYNQHEKKLHDFLLEELNNYIETFPDSSTIAEAYFLMSKIYNEKKDQDEVLATNFKIIYLFPNFLKQQECYETNQQIILKEKPYKDNQEKLNNALGKNLTGVSKSDRYFQYLSLLLTLESPKLYEWTIQEGKNFIRYFPNDSRNEQVLLWIAELYNKKGDNWEAAFSYLKFEFAFPHSVSLPLTLVNRAKLLCDELKKYEDAIKVCEKIDANFSKTEYAAPALFMIGEIKAKSLKDYEGAIVAYRKLVDTYPLEKHAVDALLALGEINAKKLKKYDNAILVYNEFIDKYRSSPNGVIALEESAKIYENDLKDYKKAAEYYGKISEIYQTYEKAPELLLKAGLICEEKLSDFEKAKEYYQIVLDKFSQDKKAKEAEKRINKLNKK